MTDTAGREPSRYRTISTRIVRNPIDAIKSAFITGVLVVIPAWLALLLLFKLLAKLGVIVRPISRQMPDGVNHPYLVAVALFVLVCVVTGLLVNTAIGRVLGHAIDKGVLRHVPGYHSLRNIARQFGEMNARDGFKPALIDVEDGCLAPAFLIEAHGGGKSTVFMPSVPTPMAGSIFIMPSERVHPLDVPVTTMMKCISKWGTGSGDLLQAHLESSATRIS
jgi:uncharacterized membrane protein